MRAADSCSGSSDSRRRAALAARSRCPLARARVIKRVAASAATLALDQQPILESGVAHRHAVQQIAAVEGNRLLQSRRTAVAQQLFKAADIGVHDRPVQHHALSAGDQRFGRHRREAAAQAQEALLQAVAGLPVAAVAPQQGGQLLAAIGHVGRDREEAQQGAIFLSR